MPVARARAPSKRSKTPPKMTRRPARTRPAAAAATRRRSRSRSRSGSGAFGVSPSLPEGERDRRRRCRGRGRAGLGETSRSRGGPLRPAPPARPRTAAWRAANAVEGLGTRRQTVSRPLRRVVTRPAARSRPICHDTSGWRQADLRDELGDGRLACGEAPDDPQPVDVGEGLVDEAQLAQLVRLDDGVGDRAANAGGRGAQGRCSGGERASHQRRFISMEVDAIPTRRAMSTGSGPGATERILTARDAPDASPVSSCAWR